MNTMFKNLILILGLTGFLTSQCKSPDPTGKKEAVDQSMGLVLGAAQFDKYLPLLEGKKVGLVVNHTSLVDGTHLVDTLLKLGQEIETVFSPEHGFTGTFDAGKKIEDQDIGYDFRVESLYGQTRKPTDSMLLNVDVVVFDLQDVGTRFYTYISTMHYMMEAATDNDIPVIILDRPNPNGSYVDGPIREEEFKSFVGMHPIPVVHGLTVGELARMIEGEGWLETENKLKLTVVPMENYEHNMKVDLPVRPSPNLPNTLAISLYPSLCFFEGTIVSIGRGTDFPFQVYGHPDLKGQFEFTPVSSFGAKYPKLENEKCYGVSYTNTLPDYRLTIQPVIDAYNQIGKDNPEFFKPYFNTLAGTATLMDQIKAGLSEDEIKASWEKDLVSFKALRAQYLLYKD